jgi:hypothetical protein
MTYNFKTPKGSDIKIECRNPYGFFYVTYSKGALPKAFRSAFMTEGLAVDAIKKHLATLSPARAGYEQIITDTGNEFVAKG